VSRAVSQIMMVCSDIKKRQFIKPDNQNFYVSWVEKRQLLSDDVAGLQYYNCWACNFKTRAKHDIVVSNSSHFAVALTWPLNPKIILPTSPDLYAGFAAIIPIACGQYSLEEVMRHPDFKNQGVGDLLMYYVMSDLQQLGAEHVQLFCDPHRRSSHGSLSQFYHHWGFREVLLKD
jgi:ribosomal protein S18 acetylase RimI-like enzyme